MDKGIWGNPPPPALTPPDHLHVPSGMARSQFKAMGTTISLLVPEEDLQRGEEMVRTLFADFEHRRHWKQGTQRRHHPLDPRTGLPADNGLWSVTVVAARCEQAEVAAKVAFLLGREQGSQFLCRHGLAGLLIQEDGTWTTAGSWPWGAMLQEEKKGAER